MNDKVQMLKVPLNFGFNLKFELWHLKFLGFINRRVEK
jgi:hypothetical protein